MAKITSTLAPVAVGKAASWMAARQSLELMASLVQSWDNVRNLEGIIAFSVADENVHLIVELVGREIDRLRADPPPLDRFGLPWFRVGGAVHLAAQCYSTPDGTFGVLLKKMVWCIDVLPELWDVLESEDLQAPMPEGSA